MHETQEDHGEGFTDELKEREDQLRPPAALMVRADLGDEAGHD